MSQIGNLCLLDSGSSPFGERESRVTKFKKCPGILRSKFPWGQEEASPSPKGKALSGWEEGFLTQMVYPTGLSSQQAPVPGTRQENGTATRLDEGLEDFFSRRVMDESSRCGAPAHLQFQQASRPWRAPVSIHLPESPLHSQSLWEMPPHSLSSTPSP